MLTDNFVVNLRIARFFVYMVEPPKYGDEYIVDDFPPFILNLFIKGEIKIIEQDTFSINNKTYKPGVWVVEHPLIGVRIMENTEFQKYFKSA